MSGTAYYNENDPHAAAWLRELIKAGHIAPGDVDERSIKDVKADDIKGYRQCHFFAGIGGWSYALRLAGWADDVAVWSGSCPCQPYSSAGKHRGNSDDRNLWPDFYRLIAQCRPDVVFGEQVEGAIRHGWLDGISADLEREGYAVGHCVLGAHSVGAPHIRQRLYWAADAGSLSRVASDGPSIQRRRSDDAEQVGLDRGAGGLSNAGCSPRRAKHGSDERERTPGSAVNGAVVDESGDRLERLADPASGRQSGRPRTGRTNGTEVADGSGMGDADSRRLQQSHGGEQSGPSTASSGLEYTASNRRIERGPESNRRSFDGGHSWSSFEFAPCRDGKARRVAPGIPLLAHGIPGRVAQLRGLGNAIVPQVAAAFIQAYAAAASLDISTNRSPPK